MNENGNGDFRETQIGALPSEWNVARLGDFIERPEYGLTASAMQNPSGPRFVRITDIQEGRINWSDVPSCECSQDEIAKYALNDGDILFARIGATTGKTLFVQHCPTAVFASYLIRVKAKPSLNSEFLSFFTNSKQYWSQIDSSKGGRLKQGVNIPILTNLTIPVPPLPEQRAIARVLSTIHRAIETQDKLIAAARELKKSLMRQLFTQGLNANGAVRETEIGVMPEHWELLELGAVADVVYGAQAAVANLKDKNSGIPILTNINITNDGELDLSTLRYYPVPANKRERLVLQKGDLLFNWRSGSQEHVGKTALFSLDGEYTFASFILRFRVNEKLQNTFLHFYLQYLKAQKFFAQKRDQSSVNSVFNASMAQKIPVMLPPLSEQREIARVLATVDKKIETEEKRKASLQALFKTMLQNLMTGQIRVK